MLSVGFADKPDNQVEYGPALARAGIVREQNRMSQVKLRTKIFGGFIFLLLLTIAMAFLGWHNLRVLVTEVEHRDTLNLIQKNALEARRQEKNYVLRGGQEYLDAVDRLVQAIKGQVAAGGQARNNQAIRESFGKILESTRLYEAAFGRYVNAGRQTDKKTPLSSRVSWTRLTRTW